MRLTTRLLWIVMWSLGITEDDRVDFVRRMTEWLADAVCSERPPLRLGPRLVREARRVARGSRAGGAVRAPVPTPLAGLSDEQLVVLAVHLYFPRADRGEIGGIFGVVCGSAAGRAVTEAIRDRWRAPGRLPG